MGKNCLCSVRLRAKEAERRKGAIDAAEEAATLPSSGGKREGLWGIKRLCLVRKYYEVWHVLALLEHKEVSLSGEIESDTTMTGGKHKLHANSATRFISRTAVLVGVLLVE